MSQIIIISFGYLHGEPPEAAHITLDLRGHFRDPHVDPTLRHMTALDRQVQAAVLKTAGITSLINAVVMAAMAYTYGPSADGNDVVIAVGCAGGRHRSGTVAIALRDLLALENYDVTLIHRDLDKPVIQR